MHATATKAAARKPAAAMKTQRNGSAKSAAALPASDSFCRTRVPEAWTSRPPSTIAPNAATTMAPPSWRKKFNVPVAVPS